ncbi:hypothetical protein HELRODRAFT_182151 [Helobdella robusta]|uniref:F5/8 type C domain-containing protein n=1 Tax=Helobdella robusta TaxID=6412 RepID=T1FHU1_HELRO|nr:hypothetical protein HELRODRAFT_182151 [Helobdella robusta]ESN91179.1 hypothetical protein HELRODRAFT_182151 [Helobdella robusta]
MTDEMYCRNVMKFWLMLCLFIIPADSRTSIATGKQSTSSLPADVCFRSEFGNDGNYLQTRDCYASYRTNDTNGGFWWMVDLGDSYYIDYVVVFTTPGLEFQLSHFIVGLANTLTPVVRNTYEVCGQYQGYILAPGFYQVKCSASLPAYRVIILQQSTPNSGTFGFAEMEVFASDDPGSKIWRKTSKYRLLKTPTASRRTRSVAECVVGCSLLRCYSMNFNVALRACELFQSLKGVAAPYFLTSDSGWDNWKAHRV